MAGRKKAGKVGGEGVQLLQGTLDMIVLRTLNAMGPQHSYQIATRLRTSFRGATEPEPGNAVSGARLTGAVWVDPR